MSSKASLTSYRPVVESLEDRCLLSSSAPSVPFFTVEVKVPFLQGRWVSQSGQQCFVRQQRGSAQAVFINPYGSQAMGFLFGKLVYIPAWSTGGQEQGLEGTVQGNRIVWANGSFWGAVSLGSLRGFAGERGGVHSPVA
jgi:hypothetical protein